MNSLQRNVLANFKELTGKPQPLSALFTGIAVSSREEVRQVVDALVERRYIEECLGTSRMPFYRRTAAGTEALGSGAGPGAARKRARPMSRRYITPVEG